MIDTLRSINETDYVAEQGNFDSVNQEKQLISFEFTKILLLN